MFWCPRAFLSHPPLAACWCEFQHKKFEKASTTTKLVVYMQLTRSSTFYETRFSLLISATTFGSRERLKMWFNFQLKTLNLQLSGKHGKIINKQKIRKQKKLFHEIFWPRKKFWSWKFQNANENLCKSRFKPCRLWNLSRVAITATLGDE